jgi:hypothetical protein
MYHAHPNRELNHHFARRPFQGAEPSKALFLFIGLDANYDKSIELSPIFQSVMEYHQDGIGFWQRHRVHHPFLLPHYSGDGRRYHKNFSRIGFQPHHASLVSFVELLHAPTVGRNPGLAPEDFDSDHLSMINCAVLGGVARHVFISAGVARLMRASGAFPWLQSTGHSAANPLAVLYSNGSCHVYQHLHFSNYGKFQQRLSDEASAIASLIPKVAVNSLE